MQTKNKDIIRYIFIASILIIAIVVRYWGLGEKSLWIDEFIAYSIAGKKSFIDSYIYMLAENSPPIYYLYLHFWIKTFGSSEFMLRLSAFIPGIIALPVLYLLAKKHFTKQTALGTLVLAALSPAMLYYSQEARPYCLLLLFSIISLFLWVALINQINEKDIKDKVLVKYCIFSLLTIFTHYWGFVLVISQLFYLVLFAAVKKYSLHKIITSSYYILLPSIAYACFHYSLLDKYKAVIGNYTRICSGSPLELIFKQIFYNNYIFLLILIILILLNIKEFKNFILFEFYEKKFNSPVIYLSYLLILIISAYLFVDKYSPILHPRHIIFTVPIAYLLISYVLNSIFNEKKAAVFCIFSAAIIFLGIYLFVPQKINDRYFTYYKMPKQEWKEASLYLLSQPLNKDTLIIIDRDRAFYYDYYLEKFSRKENKLNIVSDQQFFRKGTIKDKVSNYLKKYKKIYIFSTSMLGVDNIKSCMKTVKCNNLKEKNFVNINFYECY